MEQLSRNIFRSNPVLLLQTITIAWMTIELGISLYAGIRAHSVALTAFGADSAIELLSALIVLRRFAVGPSAERRAVRLSGYLLYVLAGFILITSALSFFKHELQPEPSVLGIALLMATAVIMPLLARAKKRLAAETGSRALSADGAQSSICGYLSWIALAGLLLNFLFHLAWADSAAALLLLPFVLKEAREASKGVACGCC